MAPSPDGEPVDHRGSVGVTRSSCEIKQTTRRTAAQTIVNGPLVPASHGDRTLMLGVEGDRSSRLAVCVDQRLWRAVDEDTLTISNEGRDRICKFV